MTTRPQQYQERKEQIEEYPLHLSYDWSDVQHGMLMSFVYDAGNDNKLSVRPSQGSTGTVDVQDPLAGFAQANSNDALGFNLEKFAVDVVLTTINLPFNSILPLPVGGGTPTNPALQIRVTDVSTAIPALSFVVVTGVPAVNNEVRYQNGVLTFHVGAVNPDRKVIVQQLERRDRRFPGNGTFGVGLNEMAENSRMISVVRSGIIGTAWYDHAADFTTPGIILEAAANGYVAASLGTRKRPGTLLAGPTLEDPLIYVQFSTDNSTNTATTIPVV